ncbi:hypothetical protein PQC13_gp129 [Synechococcus phage S-SRM01]|uniref:Uncharacterized protein n=1 Tax=Synechococcus phage S-SRM01 TaxID=2781608 RepID=A0A879R1M1_9CAUD|nr:hypothetical protein PQC13_gp129 [Synechococcus phage S-SRM01]QPX48094.1 hypothetical protein [Synechococcus phage S-SRM01]
MNAQNLNQENDSFHIIQNADGSYTANWDPQDPNWAWLNSLTSAELQVIIEQAIKEDHNGRL